MRLLCCCGAAALRLGCCYFTAALLLLYCCFCCYFCCCCASAILLLLCDSSPKVSILVAARWQSSSIDLLHELQAMKSVQAHLCKLSSLFLVSSGSDGRASKPNLPILSVLSFTRVADCNKYARIFFNTEPEAAMFTCCADRDFTFLDEKF